MYLKKEYSHINLKILDQKRLFLSYILEKNIFQKILSDYENFTLKTIIFDFCMQMSGIISCLENGNQLSASILMRPLLETRLNIEIIFDGKNKIKEKIMLYYKFLYLCNYDLYNKSETTRNNFFNEKGEEPLNYLENEFGEIFEKI